MFDYWAVWPEKNRQMSIKVADVTRKMIDFDTVKKIA